jgi:hypothetical protein
MAHRRKCVPLTPAWKIGANAPQQERQEKEQRQILYALAHAHFGALHADTCMHAMLERQVATFCQLTRTGKRVFVIYFTSGKALASQFSSSI